MGEKNQWDTELNRQGGGHGAERSGGGGKYDPIVWLQNSQRVDKRRFLNEEQSLQRVYIRSIKHKNKENMARMSGRAHAPCRFVNCLLDLAPQGE